MSKGIKVSEKYGVNPSMSICVICREPKEIILFGKLKGDIEAPREILMNIEPCKKCREKYLSKGVLLVENSIDAKQPEIHPTGRVIVITDDAYKKIFSGSPIPPRKIAIAEFGLFDKLFPDGIPEKNNGGEK